MEAQTPTLATIEQLARETGVCSDWFYQRSRIYKLPGLRRVGKSQRINRDESYAALEEGKVKDLRSPDA